jgi:methionyl aminopeptidase
LDAGCAQAKAGNNTHDIAKAIEAVAKKYEVYVVHGYGGHGISIQLHEDPHIPNELDGSLAVVLVAGKRLAIEPMFAANSGATYVAPDGWTVKTRSGLAAHFERTIIVL